METKDVDVECWDTCELAFNAESIYANPFQEVEVIHSHFQRSATAGGLQVA
jgi:hypothetical protein